MSARPLYLFGVEGVYERYNDVLFKPALPRHRQDTTAQETLVFFGGEGQNFIHLMNEADPIIPYREWCLEAAAIRLSAVFPRHHIVIIKPTRTLFDHVSCIDNFVISNFLGSPLHVYCYAAIPHLELLLKKISKSVRTKPPDELFKMLLKKQVDEDYLEDGRGEEIVWQYKLMTAKKRKLLSRWQKRLHLDLYPLTMVGFSKGCVVLNQFLYEFHYAKRLEPRNQNSSYVDLIKCMYWLDAAHPGKENVYVSSRGLLKTLVDLNIELHNHVSHYQTEDLKRPWIRRQWLEFTDTLKQFNAKLNIRVHRPPKADLQAHFNILLKFKLADSAPEPPSLPSRSPSPAPPPSPTPRTPQSEPRQTRLEEPGAPIVLGVGLISWQTDPYLGIQVILRHPLGDEPQGESSSTEQSSNPNPSSDQNFQSDAQNPSMSTDQNPSISGQHPPNFAQHPSTSKRRHRSADSFTVLMKMRSPRINFSEDLAAEEGFHIAQHFKIETPAIATPSANHMLEPGISVYAALSETYEPLLMDSTEAANLRRSGVLPPLANAVHAPRSATSNVALAAPNAITTQANSRTIRSQPNPRATQSRTAPRAAQPQSTPRVMQSQANSRAAQSQNASRAAQSPRVISQVNSDPIATPAVQPNLLASLPYEDQPTPQVARRSPRSRLQNRNSPYSANNRSTSSRYNLRSLR